MAVSPKDKPPLSIRIIGSILIGAGVVAAGVMVKNAVPDSIGSPKNHAPPNATVQDATGDGLYNSNLEFDTFGNPEDGYASFDPVRNIKVSGPDGVFIDANNHWGGPEDTRLTKAAAQVQYGASLYADMMEELFDRD